MFDYLDNAVIKLCDMQTVGTDLSTVKQQIEELKVWISSRSALFYFSKSYRLNKSNFLFFFLNSNSRWKCTSSR